MRRPLACLAAACALALPVALAAQGPGQRGGGPGGAAAAPPPTPQAAAPVDLTGYWVSIVTEDWIERMAPDSPPSGAVGGREGPRANWTPEQPPPGADPCRAYAAGGSLRVPGRLNITWADANTLEIDMDAGTQTRLLRFNAPPPPRQRSLQGHSVAEWDLGAAGRGRGGRGAPPPTPPWGSLKVVTTNMTGGYLLSSRASYSENATLTEYFTFHESFGVPYFTVTAVVEDGGTQRIASSTFKKEPDGSKFSPIGCEIRR